ncbi:inositol monophosphatase family protein [Rickettsiales bacterium LUAb2]
MNQTTPTLQIFSTAAKKVANIFTRNFNELSFMETNNNNFNYANKAFTFIENKIYEDLIQFKPNYSFYLASGKSIVNKDDSNLIIINSINGFNNFKRGLTPFAISITLLRDKQEFASVVYDPITDHMFTAEVGKGAYLNQRRLKSNDNIISSPLIATNCILNNNNLFSNSNFILSNCEVLDLCNLSAGKIDLCWFNNSINYSNLVAGIIIAKEAGYNVTFTRKEDLITKLYSASNSVIKKLNIDKI